jgi:hypothetical protein
MVNRNASLNNIKNLKNVVFSFSPLGSSNASVRYGADYYVRNFICIQIRFGDISRPSV